MNADNNKVMTMYIPRMRLSVTENCVKEVMSVYGIGAVNWVDFIPVNKKKGFHEIYEGHFKSAFVHFDKYSTMSSENVLSTFWQKLAENVPQKIPLSGDEYWICLKAINPIQRTSMNIHQIAENGRYLEDLIAEQNKELKQLRELVQKQDKQIDGLENVVYQLIGGLYCQKTQGDVIDVHLDVLGIPNSHFKDQKNTHSSGRWPTTRQGDENTKRIELLESIVHKMLFLNDKSHHEETTTEI